MLLGEFARAGVAPPRCLTARGLHNDLADLVARRYSGRVTRPASNMRAKQAYFSQKCHMLHRVAIKAAARRAETGVDDSVQAFACYSPRCRGAIADHLKMPKGVYDCVRCHARGAAPNHRMEAAR